MKMHASNGSRWVLVLALALVLPARAGNTQPDTLERARQLASQLGGELKQTLSQTIREQGLIAAIEVCQVRAPEIAERLSGQHGTRVGRVSLRPRNPENAPDTWQSATLKDFDQRQQAGEDATSLEAYRTVGGTFEYLRAIPTAELCLACHGDHLAPQIDQAIRQRYPQDQARGYQAGQLRGAFAISVPVEP